MTLGFVTTSFPRFVGDYAGTFIADRADELAASGEELDIVCAGDGVARDEFLGPDRVLRIDAPELFYGRGVGAPESLEQGSALGWARALAFTARLAGVVRARAARRRWDAVECHWLVPSGLAVAAAAPAGLPRTFYAHSGDVALLERIPLGAAVARQLIAGSMDVDLRFVSEPLRTRFSRLVGRPVGRVEPLPLPRALFLRRGARDPAARERLRLGGGPIVLAVGRLVPIKGHRALVLAAARLPPDARPEIVILGDGPERASLLALATSTGVRLRLPGFVPRAEVAEWLSAADAFAHPSTTLPNGRTEGMPVALMEARRVGLPVIEGADPGVLATALRGVTQW